MDNKLILITGIIVIIGFVFAVIKKVVKLAVVIAIVGILLSGNFAVGKVIEGKIKNINISSLEDIKEEFPSLLDNFVKIERYDDITRVNIDLFLYEKTIEIK
ncbi:hypothetical protein [Clostridium sp.]|uniref:hypothetical protein n=1 Tax=Clostridium sp. TaxID=1506 RepID=UPI001D2A0493|nr:hypothetical protein [Clostridium sp.]MBS5939025.1 hypothetical protein [Clostridium sp.]